MTQANIRQRLFRTVDPDGAAVAVDLDTVKNHCRIPTDYDGIDDLLTLYVNAAERRVEADSEIAIRPQTWKLWLSCLPHYETAFPRIRLERPPVSEITSVSYYNDSEVLTVLTDTTYYLLEGEVPILQFVRDDLPSSLSSTRLDLWQVVFEAGAETVQDNAKLAIMMLVAAWYRNPESFDQQNMVLDRPTLRLYQSLIDSLRWRY